MLMKMVKNLFTVDQRSDTVVEGLYADEYSESDLGGARAQIRKKYQQRWPSPEENKTPLTHPWLFDPCEPPQGWRYDPYYELWIKETP